MAIFCHSGECNQPAPRELEERVLFIVCPPAVVDLLMGKLDALDCPVCASKASVAPSLAAVSLVTHEIWHLDRGAGGRTIEDFQKWMAESLQAMRLPPCALRPAIPVGANLIASPDTTVNGRATQVGGLRHVAGTPVGRPAACSPASAPGLPR